jgi:hypothetical protein
MFQESGKSIFYTSALLAEVQSVIPGTPIRRTITWSPINEGHPTSLKEQETEYAVGQIHETPGAAIFPTDVPSLIAGVVVGGLVAVSDKARQSHAASHALHRDVPPWVISVDPEFANYGGRAERRELLEAETEKDSTLFELPKGYKKVNLEKLFQ